MIKSCFLISLLLYFVSCSYQKKEPIVCLYTIDSLFKDYDSSRFTVTSIDSGMTEVLEKKNLYNDRVLYRFYSNGNLNSYLL